MSHIRVDTVPYARLGTNSKYEQREKALRGKLRSNTYAVMAKSLEKGCLLRLSLVPALMDEKAEKSRFSEAWLHLGRTFLQGFRPWCLKPTTRPEP